MAFGVVALFFLLAPALTTAAGDAQGHRGLAMEAQPASRLHSSLALVVAETHLVDSSAVSRAGWRRRDGNGGIPPVSLVLIFVKAGTISVPHSTRIRRKHFRELHNTKAARVAGGAGDHE